MPNNVALWDRIVAPRDADMPEAVARYFLSMSFPAEVKERYVLLASQEQANLSTSERAELESLVQANTLLMLLQAKARLSMNQHQPAA